MYSIHFDFLEPGLVPITLENVTPGQTLLEIALQHDIDLHHDCGGVCTCTTCHIYIEKGIEYIDEKGKREEDFLKRVPIQQSNSRLGCQSLLLDGGGEINVRIPVQSRYYYE